MPSFTVHCEKGKANTIVCEVIPKASSAKASVSVRQAGVRKTATRSGRGKVTVRLKAAKRLRGKERVVVRYRSKRDAGPGRAPARQDGQVQPPSADADSARRAAASVRPQAAPLRGSASYE